MQLHRFTLALLFSSFLSNFLQAQQNVGIGTTTPDNSAMLDIVSTTKGVLIPRAETAAISSPVAGLIVYQPSDNAVYYHNGTGWQKLSGGSIVDTDGDTRVTALDATGSVDSILFEIDNQKKLVMKRGPGGELMLEPIGYYLNTFFGNDAGQSLTSGSFNSGYGASALKSNQHGNFNTGIGYESLSGNTSGAMNTALGASTLSQNTFGNFNTAIGVSALQMNITGSYNVASGFNALTANTMGNNNTAVGTSSLNANTSGSDNVAAGRNAITSNTEGNNNTGLGTSSLHANTTGSGNVATGYRALVNNTTANGNVAVGRESLVNTTNISQLVAIGDSALHYNQLGWVNNQDATQNTAVGGKAMLKNTIGKWNSAFGYHAMRENVNGVNNSAFGNNAMRGHTTGSANTALGSDALGGHLTGGSNTAVGNGAMAFNQTGSNNIGLGWRSGFNNQTGSNNIFIGTQAGYNETGSSRLYIESSDTNADSALIYGEFDNDLLRVNGNMEVNSYDPYEIGVRSLIKTPVGSFSDAPGVYGENIVDDFYGVGVHGKGGYFGVLGESLGSGSDVYTGVRGIATGLSGATTYAVYGQASGGTNNYGGFFIGKGYFSDVVGIGITQPTELLHIKGADDPTLLLQSDGVEELSGKIAMRQSNFTGMDMYYDGVNSVDALVFESFIDGTSQGRKMTMDIAGNVGIGITENIANGHKLSVNGKIACTEVRVQPQSEWPDYVFSNAYELRSLDELKTSIAEHKHLPGIPSASQIESEGLQIGDMQVRMMEKIEELTLYILQLKAEIDELKKK